MKVGLVLEGGSMRGLYDAGIMDVFLEYDIHVDLIVGNSAGALFGPNYFSRQKGRAIRYNKRFAGNKNFISLYSFITTGNIVNKQFAYYDVTFKYDVFDNETYVKNNTGYYAAVTNVETGKAEYLQLNDVYSGLEVLRASAAIPFVSKIVEIDGKKYLDGGVADSIPIKKAIELGCDKIIVILTRPIEYRKKPFSNIVNKAVSYKYKKYPYFVDAFINRYIHYNETIDYIKELEEKGEIFVFRPQTSLNVGTIEKDREELQKVYDQGYNDGINNLERLKEYLNEVS